MSYCVLCQEEHEMNDNCMKNVMCKGCGKMGHLRISCRNSEQIDPVPSNCSDVRNVFDSDSDPAEDMEDMNMSKDSKEIYLAESRGEKRKLTDLESGNATNAILGNVSSYVEEEVTQPVKRHADDTCLSIENTQPVDSENGNTEYYEIISAASETFWDEKPDTKLLPTFDSHQELTEGSTTVHADGNITSSQDGPSICLTTSEKAIQPKDDNKLTEKKVSTFSSRIPYQLMFIHIETFWSNKSSSTLLTQIGCFSGSSEFFCAIKPAGLSKYLDSYKLGGDLLRALHMTREGDGTFQFRSQFEIVTDPSKIILCVSEKEAIKSLLEFLKGFSNPILVAVDEDTLSRLLKTMKDYGREKYKKVVMNVMMQGYTYWRRILKYLHVPGYNDIELEEFYNELSETDLSGYLSSKDIAKVLMKSVEEVITKYCHSDTNVKGKFVSKTCRKIEDLPRPRKKPYDRKITREDIEVYSSFRPSVSTTISAEKMDQIMLTSGSESEVEDTVEIVDTVGKPVQILNMSGDILEVPFDVMTDVKRGLIDNKGATHVIEINSDSDEEPYTPETAVGQKPALTWKFLSYGLVMCPFCKGTTQVKFPNIMKHLRNFHKRSDSEMSLECDHCPQVISPMMFLNHLLENPNHVKQQQTTVTSKPKQSKAKNPMSAPFSYFVKKPNTSGFYTETGPSTTNGNTTLTLQRYPTETPCGKKPANKQAPPGLPSGTLHSVETDHGPLTNLPKTKTQGKGFRGRHHLSNSEHPSFGPHMIYNLPINAQSSGPNVFYDKPYRPSC